MTLTLAVDTVTPFGSVAIGSADRLVAEVVLGERRHATAVVPAIEQCLSLGGRTLADVDHVVLADGPGSFTGIRIGLASMLGYLTEIEIPLSVAPSLMGAAWGAARGADGAVAAAYVALRGEVFAAVYRFAPDRVETLCAPTRVTPEAIMGRYEVETAVGEGWAPYGADVRAWCGHDPVLPPRGIPRASALLALHGLPGATGPVDPAQWQPTYGRAAEAQVKWEEKHGRPLPDSRSKRS